MKGDGHSQAILLIRTPAQIMLLNQMHEDFRAVDDAEELVGAETLQQNRLYFAKTAEQFGQAQEVIVNDYNAGTRLFSSKSVELYAMPADETMHAPALFNRQFTAAPSGYGCSFKTTGDMEEMVLSSDLQSKVKQDVAALACLAMEEKPVGRPADFGRADLVEQRLSAQGGGNSSSI